DDGQWQQALLLLRELRDTRLEPDAISISAAIRACETAGQSQQALSLLRELPAWRLEPDATSAF
ncbi:unnamed protein product, partial [Prorocentrum cordatum]